MNRPWIGVGLAALLAAAGCAQVSPGVAEQRARAAEVAQQGGDVTIAQYQAAARAGALGSVQGRAYEERRKPNAAEAPLDGTILLLLPRSETFLSTLDTIKQQARASLDRYRESAGAVRRAREAYETALLQRGGGDLARSLVVNPDGSFTVGEVPAGEWILVGAHTVFGKKAPLPNKEMARGSTDRFLPRTRLLSHSYVALWLQEVTVSPGGAATVELTDRNIWFTGVLEETETPVFRAGPPLTAPSVLGAGEGLPLGSSGSGAAAPPPR